jgi:hypothetical protein
VSFWHFLVLASALKTLLQMPGMENVRKMPDMHILLGPPNIFLILGVVSLSVGVISTCTGETWVRFGRVIRRDKEPSEFWEDVVACYLIGVCFIGYFLYRVT